MTKSGHVPDLRPEYFAAHAVACAVSDDNRRMLRCVALVVNVGGKNWRCSCLIDGKALRLGHFS